MLLGVRSSSFTRLFVIVSGHLSSEAERVQVCSGNCIMNEILKKREKEEQAKKKLSIRLIIPKPFSFPFFSAIKNLFFRLANKSQMFFSCASLEPYLARGYPIRIRIIVDGTMAQEEEKYHTQRLES